MNDSQLAKSWSSENAVTYYMEHRDNAEELYESEKHFIGDVLKKGRTVLDIGCAAGGFSKIIRQYNKSIKYTGVDISPQMIKTAKRKFPQDEFYLCDGGKLDFPDKSFDICICFGVLHMTERWKELLSQAWRVCRDTILFDLRIAEDKGICDANLSYQRLEFGMKWDGISKAPYVVVSLEEVIDYLINMTPKVRSLRSYGYWAPISKMTVSEYARACMSVFCLGKKSADGIFDWRLPLMEPYRMKRFVKGR